MEQQAFPVFTTDRLHFRQLQPKDVYPVFELFSDKDTMRFDGGRTMGSINEAFQFISVFSVFYPNSYIRWVVESRETGEFLGTAGFHKLAPEARRGEIGGELLKKSWGAGIGKEALFGLNQYAFNDLGLNRITAMISPQNLAAQKIVERMGYQREGRLRDWEYWDGKFIDMDVFSLLSRDWQTKIKNH